MNLWGQTTTSDVGHDPSKPDWLQDVDTEAGGGSTTEKSDFTTIPVPGPNSAALDDTDKKATSRGSCCMQISVFLISLVFLGLFVYSAKVQDGDVNNSTMWMIFYALHAGAVGLFLMARLCFVDVTGFVTRPLMILLISLTGWAVALVISSTLNYMDAEDGGSDVGGDSDRMTDSEEKVMEIAGAVVALVSNIYHAIAWKCCIAKKKE